MNDYVAGSSPPQADPGWDIPGVTRAAPAGQDPAPGSMTAGPTRAGPGPGAARRARPPAAPLAGPLPGPLPGGTPADGLVFDGPAAAVAALAAASDYLAHADPGSWTEDMQGDCLRALAGAQARQTAAHARVLEAFSVPGGGLARDGHGSPRVWLTWQTRATRRAAAAQVGWMRRLAGHPVLAAALADGSVSPSWARQIADWTSTLPQHAIDAADTELLAAAAAGAGPGDLARVAEDQRREHATADGDPDDGFEDRAVRVAATFGGAGRIEGDLTPRAAAAVTAVLESLSAVRGPEDDRTLAQRQHDALEEACTRLIGAGMLPQRAGQPVRLDLEITLQELTENAGGVACDALVQPMVTGHIDYGLLEELAKDEHQAQLAAAMTGREADARQGLLAEQAIALLSGPAGRAAALRQRLAGVPAIPVSLPLDVPATIDTPPTSGARSANATSTAASPAATCPRPAATSTTSSTAKTAAGTPSPTWPCCAGSTTSSPSTAGAGPSPSTRTAPPPPPAPTAARSCTATRPPEPPNRIRQYPTA